jgi:hypothetical protein
LKKEGVKAAYEEESDRARQGVEARERRERRSREAQGVAAVATGICAVSLC